MLGEPDTLVGAGADIDEAEYWRPRRAALGDDRIDHWYLVRPDLGGVDREGARKQQPGELEAHGAQTPQPAAAAPASSCSPNRASVRCRAASAFFTTFQ